jgi:hypothetical protein
MGCCDIHSDETIELAIQLLQSFQNSQARRIKGRDFVGISHALGTHAFAE